MIRILLVIIIISITGYSYAQNVFHKMYFGVSGVSMFRHGGFLITADNGFMIGNQGSLLKLDSTGTTEWRYNLSYIPNQNVSVTSIVKTIDQGYMLSGYPVLISLDSFYNINWIKEILNNNTLGIRASQQIDSLSFIFCGEIFLNNKSLPCFIKTDSSGNIIWSKVYDSSPLLEAVNSIDVAADGSIIACATSRSIINPSPYFDGVVFKIDASGNVLWAKRFTKVGETFFANSIKATNDGNIVVVGSRNLPSWMMKLDLAGNVLWQKSYASGSYGMAIDVTCTADNGFALAGDGVDMDPVFGGLGQTAVLIKTDSLGNLEWSKYLGGFANVFSSKIVQTSDQGYAIAGRRSYSNGVSLNLIKTDSLGNTGGCLELNTAVMVTNLNDTVIDFILIDSSITMSTIPYSATFPQIGSEIDICNWLGFSEINNRFDFDIYPNPSYGNFEIHFSQPSTTKLTLTILNLFGESVYTREISTQEQMQKVEFNPNDSGIYIVKIKMGEQSYYKKIFVLHK